MRELKSGVPIVRALERGLALLRLFSRSRPRQTLSELARGADLDVGTTRRLLQTLIVAEFVGFSETASKYYLTNRIREIASAVEACDDLRDIGRNFLEDIAQKTGATAFLWTYSEGRATCVDRVRAVIPNVDATWFAVGASTALNSGGGPRVLFAYLDEQEQAKALSHPFPEVTPMSIVDAATLVAEAKIIRSRGWALAVDDFVVGLAGLGVPIFTSAGRLAGALSVSTLTTLFGDRNSPRYLAELKQAAASIGGQLSEQAGDGGA